LWSLRWEDLNVWEDREDIVMAVFNEGRIEQIRWVLETYGKDEIRKIFSRRLVTEFHPESRNLASVLIPDLAFRHAR
jgi:hypothetical protein